MKMDAADIHRRLRAQFGNDVSEELSSGPKAGTWSTCEIRSSQIAEICRWLRDDPEIKFDCLSNLSGVDRKNADAIEVHYHLYSYKFRHQIALRASTPRLDPVLPTISAVWPTADWLERECFDLLGVRFTGHPDLRRILMPEDWVGHPLRKDFVEPDEYHGISTRRESLLKL
jgi:NADH-quinone oxidoreductase subunit C